MPHLWCTASLAGGIFGELHIWCDASMVCWIFGALHIGCKISLVYCIFGVMYMHFWYAMHRHLCWCLVGAITIVQFIFGALFLGLGCNIFFVLHCQLYRTRLLPQWRIFFMIWMDDMIDGWIEMCFPLTWEVHGKGDDDGDGDDDDDDWSRPVEMRNGACSSKPCVGLPE